jgi:hypothetical protein
LGTKVRGAPGHRTAPVGPSRLTPVRRAGRDRDDGTGAGPV